MVQDNNVIILQKILQKHNVTRLADLADKPKLFCKVFKETFSLMNQELLSSSEDKLPTPILVVIRDDLFTLTTMLLQYPNIAVQNPDQHIDTLYPLKSLRQAANAARAEIIVAIGAKSNSSINRTKRIQNCIDRIVKSIEIIEEFEHRRI